MGMIAFYAGLLMGVLLGVVLMSLLSGLGGRGDVSEMPVNPCELKTP